MEAHHIIRRRVAEAIRDSEAVKTYAVEMFGKGALVIMDWYGADGDPGEEQAPFVFVFSAGETDEAGFVDEESCTVRVVCGAVDPNDHPFRETVTARNDGQNGLVVNGIIGVMEGFRAVVEQAIRAAAVGATARKFSREEVVSANFPLEWVALEVEFYEPQTL